MPSRRESSRMSSSALALPAAPENRDFGSELQRHRFLRRLQQTGRPRAVAFLAHKEVAGSRERARTAWSCHMCMGIVDRGMGSWPRALPSPPIETHGQITPRLCSPEIAWSS